MAMNQKQREFIQETILKLVEDLGNLQDDFAQKFVRFTIFGAGGMTNKEQCEFTGAMCDVGAQMTNLQTFVEHRFEKLLQKTIVDDLEEWLE